MISVPLNGTGWTYLIIYLSDLDDVDGEPKQKSQAFQTQAKSETISNGIGSRVTTRIMNSYAHKRVRIMSATQ